VSSRQRGSTLDGTKEKKQEGKRPVKSFKGGESWGGDPPAILVGGGGGEKVAKGCQSLRPDGKGARMGP